MAKFSTLLIAAPVALLVTTVPTAAQEEIRSTIVRYDDLNLSSASGRSRLTTRVKYAVETVCKSRPTNRQALQARVHASKCEKRAMRDVEPTIANLINGSGTRVADQGQVVVSAR